MVNSRNKGAAFERHIVRLLNDLLLKKGIKDRVKRNLEQYQTKDLPDIYFKDYAIECKRYKSRNDTWPLPKWWDQTVNSAGKDFVPILIYKYDHQPIMSVFPLAALNNELPYDPHKIAVTKFADFLKIAEVSLENSI